MGCSAHEQNVDMKTNKEESNDVAEKERISAANKEYWQVVANGVVGILSNHRSTWYGEQAFHYRKEQETLQRYIDPFYWGLGTTVLLLINLRVTGHPRFQRLRQDWLEKLRQYVKPPTSTTKQGTQPATHQKPPQEWTNYLEKQRIEKEKNAMNQIKLLTDILVSISVGTSATLFLLEAEKVTLRKDFEESPLVYGRSLVADTMCAEMMDMDDKFKLPLEASQDDALLGTFAKFVDNCRLRSDYEAKIRYDQGKSIDEPVWIPYPGIKR